MLTGPSLASVAPPYRARGSANCPATLRHTAAPPLREALTLLVELPFVVGGWLRHLLPFLLIRLLLRLARPEPEMEATWEARRGPRVPPLRGRPADLAPLARHFIALPALLAQKALSFSAEGMARVLGHTWPGNIRKLEHASSARWSWREAPGSPGSPRLGEPPGSIRRATPAAARAISVLERDRILAVLHRSGRSADSARRVGASAVHS